MRIDRYLLTVVGDEDKDLVGGMQLEVSRRAGDDISGNGGVDIVRQIQVPASIQ